jgi:hypothetical protein
VKVDLRYLGSSGVRESARGDTTVAFAPNLARPRVFFDGELADPVRYREAMSALHDVVVGDLRAKKKDKTAYLAWQQAEKQRETAMREALLDRHKREALAKIAAEPISPNLEADFRRMHSLYWTARRAWAAELSRNDPELFRHLVPCDPVVTVAPDVVFFEAFAKDESSYGCLTVARDAFRGPGGGDAGIGTTNVDYSLALYEHFQTLRTYRPTRLLVDPSGFDVKVAGAGDLREEKIDLPPSWLRGFGQLQASLALPRDRVELSVDLVYSLLTFLKRHREKKGPRCIRFELTPGEPPSVVIDPWGTRLQSRGRAWDGDAPRTIKVWGRRRLFALARLLPLAERFEVALLGTGLPSVWIAHMREMRFVLALSGWTANDWTGGSSLDQRLASFHADAAVTETLARYLETARRATLVELAQQTTAPKGTVLGSLHVLAKRGQLAYDFGAEVVRWRPILAVPLSDAALGPEPEETVEGRRLAAGDAVALARNEPMEGGKRLLVAKVQGTSCEGIVDADGGFTRAKCTCSFFHRTRLRAGPCRHLIALRSRGLGIALEAAPPPAPKLETAVAGVVTSVVFQLPAPALEAMRAEAARRGETLGAIADQAWRIARDRIKAAASLAPLGAAPSADPKVPQSFDVTAGVAVEIQSEAARLDVSVSAAFLAAWSLAKDAMRLTSSLLP